MLDKFTDYYFKLWQSSSDQFPEISRTYSDSDQFRKDQYLGKYIKSLKALRLERNTKFSQGHKTELSILKYSRDFFANGLDFSDVQLELLFSDGMVDLTRTFVRQAQLFDSTLSFHDIFQACRNAWIMHGLQFVFGIPMALSPSILAYSLLYPYTDNLIDAPEISDYEKICFSERFRDRLSGKPVESSNPTEIAVFRLIEMIENQYSRIDFPEVFQSLLDIHTAQTNSLRLIRDRNSISESDILKICIAKGGASVLADGFLIAGRLTEQQQNFLFGFGTYLQLLDDIQDVDEDHKSGLMTIFSKDFCRINLDSKLNKTYWFGERVMKNLDWFDGGKTELFKSLMRKSMDLFVIEAIAQNPETYSRKYVSEIEAYSPFHFSFIRKCKRQLKPYNNLMLSAIEGIAFTESVSSGKTHMAFPVSSFE
jgi:hypothetical protein